MLRWNVYENVIDMKTTWMSKIQKSYPAHLIWDGDGIYGICLEKGHYYGFCPPAILREMAGIGSLVQNGLTQETA